MTLISFLDNGRWHESIAPFTDHNQRPETSLGAGETAGCSCICNSFNLVEGKDYILLIFFLLSLNNYFVCSDCTTSTTTTNSKLIDPLTHSSISTTCYMRHVAHFRAIDLSDKNPMVVTYKLIMQNHTKKLNH